jgi:hypothetical protein
LEASFPLSLGIVSLKGRIVSGGSSKNSGGRTANGKSSCTGTRAGWSLAPASPVAAAPSPVVHLPCQSRGSSLWKLYLGERLGPRQSFHALRHYRGEPRLHRQDHRAAVVAFLQRVADQPQPRAEPCCFLDRTVSGGEQARDLILGPHPVGAADACDQRAGPERQPLRPTKKAVAVALREFEHANFVCRQSRPSYINPVFCQFRNC